MKGLLLLYISEFVYLYGVIELYTVYLEVYLQIVHLDLFFIFNAQDCLVLKLYYDIKILLQEAFLFLVLSQLLVDPLNYEN